MDQRLAFQDLMRGARMRAGLTRVDLATRMYDLMPLDAVDRFDRILTWLKTIENPTRPPARPLTCPVRLDLALVVLGLTWEDVLFGALDCRADMKRISE